jgi:homoserine O-acetyltransferase
MSTNSTGATRYHELPSPFRMRRGGELRGARIAFETWGQLDAARGNAVLILTGMSPSAHAASSRDDPSPGWWEDIVGPGKAIDTRRWFVICVNSLGSCRGSTGPASIDAESGETWRLRFPDLTLEDVALSAAKVVRGLGVERLRCIVGPSMGGMSALAYALNVPDAADHLLLLSTAPHSLPFSIAIRSLQREFIRTDPAWNGGNYGADAWPVKGMLLARKLGMTTYRSAHEWRQRFARTRVPESERDPGPFAPEFAVESYLAYQAERFVTGFDPNCYLYLSRAMDWFDVADYGGTVAVGLSRIRARSAMVIGVETDLLFPIEQQEEIAEGLRDGGVPTQFVPLPSIQGHDAFLVDTPRFGKVIGGYMASL